MLRFKKGHKPWNYGLASETSELVKKIAEKRKGQKFTPEQRKRMSEAQKGHKPWNKGKKLTESQKKNFSLAQKKRFEMQDIWNKGTKGVMPDPWNKGKKGVMPDPWNKGKKGLQTAWNKGTTGVMKANSGSWKKGRKTWNEGLRKETDDSTRISAEKRRGQKRSEESRRRMKEVSKKLYANGWSPRKGKKHSEVTKQRLSEMKMGSNHPNFGKHLPTKHRKNISKGLEGHEVTDSTKAKLREIRLHQKWPPKDTKPEKVLQEMLRNNEIKFEKHKPILGQPDIFIEPNICIFADGDWFHGYMYMNGFDCNKNKVMNNQYFEKVIQRDKKKTQLLIEDGYNVLRLWEHEILENPEKCLQKILKAIK